MAKCDACQFLSANCGLRGAGKGNRNRGEECAGQAATNEMCPNTLPHQRVIWPVRILDNSCVSDFFSNNNFTLLYVNS